MSFNVSLSISSTGNAPKERAKRKKKKKSLYMKRLYMPDLLTFDNLITDSETMISNDRILDLYPKGVFSCILTYLLLKNLYVGLIIRKEILVRKVSP